MNHEHILISKGITDFKKFLVGSRTPFYERFDGAVDDQVSAALIKQFLLDLIKKEETDQQRSQHDQFWKLIQLQKKTGIHQSESCEFLCINQIKLGCIKNGIQHFLITRIDTVELEFKDVVFFRTLPGP